jgi:hypothetical protein
MGFQARSIRLEAQGECRFCAARRTHRPIPQGKPV